MQMPSNCNSAIPERKERSKRCSRSRSWIFGATVLAPQSRTIFATAACSSLSSNPIMVFPLFLDGLAVLRQGLPGREGLAGGVFLPGRHHHAHERERAHVRQRLLLEALVEHARVDARIAQLERDQLGLEQLA